MGTIESTTFQSDHRVAVGLPAAVALAPGIRVTVERDGNVLTIRPIYDDLPQDDRIHWHQMLADLERLPLPPSVEERDFVDVPGLKLEVWSSPS